MNTSKGKRRLMSEMNVVPYIDVMLVLLIIFMITAPLLTQGITVDLPNAPASQLDPELLRESANERRRPDTSLLATARGLSLGRGRNGRDRLGSRLLFGRGARTVLADHDEHGADRDDVSFGDEDPRDLAAGRRRDLDRRLVRLHLDQRVVLDDLLALGDEPARDLALRQALAEVGQLELVCHA